MQGLMQNWPLTVDRIIDHAAAWRPQGEVFTAAAKGAPSRTTYGQMGARARRLAAALAALGLRRGDVAAVIGANTARQLEAWYAITGMGAVCHPLDPDLPEDRMAALLTLGGDRLVFVDPALLPAVEPALRRAPMIEHVVVLGEDFRLPQSSLADVVSHEALIRKAGDVQVWGGLEEDEPAVLVHTVGVSGPPKGVVWTHRSCVLQAMTAIGPDGLGLSSREAILPLIPFWRGAGWGLVFSGPLAGAKLVLAGAQTDPQSVRVLIDREAVSLAVGSPANLQSLYDQFRGESRRPNRLMRVIFAGGFCPPALARAWRTSFGVEVRSAWGLIETSTLGAVSDPLAGDLRPPFGLELEIADASGQPAPHDGVAIGRLKARGAVAASGYLGGAAADASTFLDTGDLASIDPEGRIRLMGRADETVSAGDAPVPAGQIEDAALAHPATAEAVVIDAPAGFGVNGPVLLVQRRPEATTSKSEYLRFVGGKIGFALAPEEVLFVDGFPRDPLGRVDKKVLREKLERLAPRIAPPPAAPAPEPAPPAEPAHPPVAVPALMAAGEVIYEPPPPPPVEPPKPDPAEPQPLIEVEASDHPAATAAAGSAEVLEPPAPGASESEQESHAPAAPSPEDLHAPAVEAEETAPVEAEPPPIPDASDAPDAVEALAEQPVPAPEASGAAGHDPAPQADLAEAAPSTDTDESPAAIAEAKPEAQVPAPVLMRIEEPEPLTFVRLNPPAPRRRRAKPQPMTPARVFMSCAAALAVLPLAIILSGVAAARLGLADWRYGLHELLYEWPFKLSLVGVAAGVLAIFVGLNIGLRQVWRRAAVSLVLPLLTVAALVGIRAYSDRFPPLHDVATDWTNPIRLSQTLMQARGPYANPVEDDPIVAPSAVAYMNRRVAEVNADTCPAAQPVFLPLPPGQAYARAKAALQAAGLQIVTDDLAAGRIEAMAQGMWLGFADDAAIRVKPDPKGSRIDLRSISRQGQNDLGANCRRIARLIQAIQGG